MTDAGLADGQGLLLPVGARLVHVGPPKTGSTAIQSALAAARPHLAEHSVAYPGNPKPRHAVQAVLGLTTRWRGNHSIALWEGLTRAFAEAGDRRACLSSEDLSRATPEQARRIVTDLGEDRVHVVAVARRLDRFLPSQWQERIKHAEVSPYEEWLERILLAAEQKQRNAAPGTTHDVATIASRWVETVGGDRFTLIVSDESDRSLLSRTFEELLGLPAGMLATVTRSNSSLSLNGAELLRGVNQVFAERGWPDPVYHNLVIDGLVPGLLGAPRNPLDRPIPPLPDWAVERVAALSEKRVGELRELGVNVVGDLDTLLVEPAAVGGQPATAETLSVELAVRAVEGLVSQALEVAADGLSVPPAPARRVAAKAALAAGLPQPPGAARRRTGRPAGPTVAETGSVDLLRTVAARVKRRAARAVRRG